MLRNEVPEALLHSKSVQLTLKCIVFLFTFYFKQRKYSKKWTLLFKLYNKFSLMGHMKSLCGPHVARGPLCMPALQALHTLT
jgi:hypothetical protein